LTIGEGVGSPSGDALAEGESLVDGLSEAEADVEVLAVDVVVGSDEASVPLSSSLP
jgi:hypothetical protein